MFQVPDFPPREDKCNLTGSYITDMFDEAVVIQNHVFEDVMGDTGVVVLCIDHGHKNWNLIHQAGGGKVAEATLTGVNEHNQIVLQIHGSAAITDALLALVEVAARNIRLGVVSALLALRARWWSCLL